MAKAAVQHIDSSFRATDRRRLLCAVGALAGAAAVNVAAIALAKGETAPVADACVAPPVDPVFDRIEEWNEAKAEFQHASEIDLGDDATNAASFRETEALAAFLETTPTSLAGCAAAFRHIHAVTERYGQGGLFEEWRGDVRDPALSYLTRVADLLDALTAVRP